MTALTARQSPLPLFPLDTILFPDGVLPLRVFEARYVDMVRRAMRDDSTFGVVLIRRGRQVGDREVVTESVGCRARIRHWDMEQLGVLQISTVGTERFTIVDRRVEDDGLVVADVVPFLDEPSVPPPEDAAACVSLLEQVLSRIDDEATGPMGSPVGRPYRFDDATWVGNRLCEMLPIPPADKQRLMAMADGPARLEEVAQFLRRHRIG